MIYHVAALNDFDIMMMMVKAISDMQNISGIAKIIATEFVSTNPRIRPRNSAQT